MLARRPLVLLGSLLALAAPASALTLLQLSGSGHISIDVTGSIFLDTGGNVFDTITLAASDSVATGGSSGVAGTTLTLSGLDGYVASFTDDLALEILSWSGSLSLTTSGTLSLGGPLFAEGPPGSPGPCDVSGGVVITAGGPAPADPCDDLVIVSPPGGPIIVVPPVITPGVLVPEPSAAVIFAIGLALVRARTRRRAP